MSKVICLALLASTIFIFSPPNGGDTDIWWHLKYGEHFVKNYTLQIDHSIFSWTIANPDWKYVTWLASSLLYLFYTAAGFPGIFILHSFLFILIFVLYILYIRLIGKKLDIPDIFCMLLVALSANSPYIKPDSFTTLFFAIAVFVYFYSKTASKSIFLLYIPLFLIWVNTHGGFIIGLFFITLTFMLEAVNYYLIKKSSLSKNSMKDLALSVFMSYAITAINPYGPQYISSIFRDLYLSDYMEQSKYLYSFLSIWKQLLPTSDFLGLTFVGWYLMVEFVILILVLVFTFSRIKKIDPVIIVINIVFFLIAMFNARSAKLFPIIWLFSIASISNTCKFYIPQKKIAMVSLFLFVLFTAIRIEVILIFNNHNSWLGRDFIISSTPEKESAFITNYKLPGPIFNDYSTGGYMIWSLYPKYKVFIDPRYGPYTNELRSDCFESSIAPNQKTIHYLYNKYKFNSVFLSLTHPMVKPFMDSPDWKLVYFCTQAAVFIRSELYELNKAAFNSVDLCPDRFSRVNDPSVLMHIFNLYNYMSLTREMSVIRSIYERNVSNYYLMKSNNLYIMDFILKIKSNLKESLQ